MSLTSENNFVILTMKESNIISGVTLKDRLFYSIFFLGGAGGMQRGVPLELIQFYIRSRTFMRNPGKSWRLFVTLYRYPRSHQPSSNLFL